ncbi:cupredoxin domain-containing protein [Candidatus Nitrosocosmicus arcticus]|uniref:Blue (Type 1) copper domain protein n=1 Tax=Candidatus Nitrosocosmicus arcticus TaxID=2035267 RepID=A0A557SR34_9ARCH|nr:cupredoxin domain-containing protein [Candidatus Nitrosocosmicus arcticus]TVP39066.1 blue (type 1) copper domain protein [Candidatus Nitrosocosmicus arcticus]
MYLLHNIIAIIVISFIIVGALWGIGSLLNTPQEKNIQKSNDSILLVAQNNAFNQTNPTLYVNASQPTRLIILNKDFVKHDFISEELGINTAYLTTEQDFVTGIASNKMGNYTYYCSFHPDMKGEIVIKSSKI